jgi:hypothetical protein
LFCLQRQFLTLVMTKATQIEKIFGITNKSTVFCFWKMFGCGEGGWGVCGFLGAWNKLCDGENVVLKQEVVFTPRLATNSQLSHFTRFDDLVPNFRTHDFWRNRKRP